MKETRPLKTNAPSITAWLDNFHWEKTSLGPRNEWPDTLRYTINLCLLSKTPVALVWGNAFVLISNEVLQKLLHWQPHETIGMPLDESPLKSIDNIFQHVEQVFETGEGMVVNNVAIRRSNDGPLPLHFNISFVPVVGDTGTVDGVLLNFVPAASRNHQERETPNRKLAQDGEERLRIAIESACIGTWDYWPGTSTLSWSDESKKIYGVSPEKEVNLEIFYDRIHPADRGDVERAIAAAMAYSGTGHYDVTFRISRINDGAIRWVTTKGKMFFNDHLQPERFVGTMVDITDQKSLEETLIESELRTRLAIEASELGTFDWNIKGSEFKYSDRVAEIFGFPNPKGLSQSDFAERIHPDDRDKRLQAHEIAFEKGMLFYEVRIVWPDESIHWVRLNGKVIFDENGTPSRMYGTTADITSQRTYAEKLEREVAKRTNRLHERNLELKRSEERYHKMVDEVQDYAIILLDREGYVRNWNLGAEKIKQYSEEEIMGKHFSIFYLPEDLQSGLPNRLMNEAIVHGRASQEGWRKRKDGSKFWGSITITALHDEQNDVIGFSKVTRDLTEKKAAEDKLLRYAGELESQNKELEQFAYVASHDLQEPLRKIQTFSELIQENMQDERAVKRYFSKINDSARRMSELIKSVLNFSRLTRVEADAVNVDLNVTIANIQTDFELLIAEKHATIIVHQPLPTVKGIPLQLSQLFANLISNGLKFSQANPRIEIGCRVVQKSEVIQAPSYLENVDYDEITVSDNGIGFDQQYEKLIFQMFKRLHSKQQYAGTGIGLALCKKIVENHNGYIAATGEQGKGSTFYVYFPRSN